MAVGGTLRLVITNTVLSQQLVLGVQSTLLCSHSEVFQARRHLNSARSRFYPMIHTQDVMALLLSWQ